MMIKLKFFLLLSFLFVREFAMAQTNMFRGTPDHASYMQTNKKIVFAEESWKFNVEAPVRSTAVTSNQSVFLVPAMVTCLHLIKIRAN